MAKKKKRPLVDPRYANIVFIIGIISIASGILLLLDLIDISEKAFFFNVGLLGAGFVLESSFVATIKRVRDGLTGDEIVHLITLIFGFVLIVAGSIGFVKGQIPANLRPIAGLGMFISLFLALIQRYLVR